MFSLRVDGISISVTAENQSALLSEVRDRMRERLGFAIATLNLDHLVKLRKASEFRRAYEKQDIVTADGHPIVWLSRLSSKPVSLVTGSDLVDPLARLAAEEQVPVALLGSTPQTLAAAASELTARYPGLVVVACLAPGQAFDPHGAEADRLIAALRESGAGMAFLALGAPRQEIFAARCRELLPGIGFASVGAGLDFIAGRQRRAPVWFQRLALEWLWRAACEPRRLGLRYLECALALPRVTVETLLSERLGRASMPIDQAPMATRQHVPEVL